jgi:hypothetical protein
VIKSGFLNESGGGIISKIVSHGLVNVAIEDGFEIPTMVSNLIKIEEESAPSIGPVHSPSLLQHRRLKMQRRPASIRFSPEWTESSALWFIPCFSSGQPAVVAHRIYGNPSS